MRIVTPFNVDAGQLTTTNVVNEVADWEPAATNLLSYPRQFDNAVWTSSGTEVRPQLTTNGLAYKLYGLSGAKYLVQGVSLENNTTYAYTLVVEASELDSVRINFRNKASQFTSVTYNLLNGETSGNGSGNVVVEDLVLGRAAVTLILNSGEGASTPAFFIYPSDSGGTEYSAAEGIYLWHAQLEEGSFPTSIIPDGTTFTSRASTATYLDSTGTLQTAAVDVARDDAYGYVDGVLKPIGLLLEKARTNFIKYSSTATASTNINWVKGSTSVTENFVTAPDGTVTADKLSETTSDAQHFLEQRGLLTSVGNYTQSLFLKEGTTAICAFSVVHVGESVGTTSTVSINLSLGTISSPSRLITKTNITALADGWFRASITYTLTGSATDVRMRIFVGTETAKVGDPDSFICIWGAQLEEGSYPTSYIPTQGTQVTRAADVSSSPQVTRAADACERVLGDEFNPKNHTVYVEFIYKGLAEPGKQDGVVTIGEGYGNSFTGLAIAWRNPQSNIAYITVRHLGTPLNIGGALNLGVLATGSTIKLAYSLHNNNVVACVGGVIVGESAIEYTPQFTPNMRLGQSVNDAWDLTGKMPTLQIFPSALLEAELIILTGGN